MMRTEDGFNAAAPSPDSLESSLLEMLSLTAVHASRGVPGTIEVVEITDLQCPACAISQQALAPVLASLAQEGRIHHTLIDAPLPSHSAAIPASVTAGCVQQSSPQSLAAFRAAVYERQDEWSYAYPVEAVLLQIADDVGIDTTDIRECITHEGSDRAARHRRARNALSEAGFGFVPVFSINGKVVPWPQLRSELSEAVGDLSVRTGK